MYFVSSAPLLFWSDTYHTVGLFYSTHIHILILEKNHTTQALSTRISVLLTTFKAFF